MNNTDGYGNGRESSELILLPDNVLITTPLSGIFTTYTDVTVQLISTHFSACVQQKNTQAAVASNIQKGD